MSKITEHDEQHVLHQNDFEDQRSEWSHKQFERMVWKTRWKFFVNAGGTLLLIFLLYHVYIYALHMYFDQSKVRNEFMRTIVSVVEMNGDGLRVDKTNRSAFEVTPFLTQKATLKVYRLVGSWEVITGEIQAELSITGKFSYSLSKTGSYLNGNDSGPFYLPYTLVDGPDEYDDSEKNGVIKRLRKLDDGYVAELSISLKNLKSPEQLMQLLSKYDVGVTAMPVYSGEMQEKNLSYSRAGMYDYIIPHLTLKPLYQMEDGAGRWFNYFPIESEEQEQSQGTMKEQIDFMMSDLEWILSSNLQYSGAELDQRRLIYLKKNGVQVYGAVITGPVRELQKLIENPEFQHAYLNRVEMWNWD
ncbi:MAG: anti sigma factor C-terminal domain-containing protein [Paenibacillus sp.]|uniref:anti sigma factor C-terminal domain-containing protein n=1 Tax=Paenibacillus sp. TaxID=58172 RepID=UPI0025CF01D4|nr:anti sigma factor C-terminal domain-containing protein [Paenibacillus sp.]MBR2566573.1 anti sigma factor C-terminal domain-containing protein [Paenibacillus sp.]